MTPGQSRVAELVGHRRSQRPTPGPKRRRWVNTHAGAWTIRVMTLIVVLVSWEIYARGVSRALFVGPIEIAGAAYDLTIQDTVILEATLISFGSLVLGLGASIVIGVLVGLTMGRVRIFERVLNPYVSFFQALPSIVLIPLLLVWLGLGLQLRVVLVILASVFPVIINTAVGVRQVPADLLEVGRMHCATERQTVRTIIIPSAIPYIFAGIRQALSQALVMVVVAEILVAVTGLGGLMVTYGNYFQTADLFVPLLVIMALSLLLTDILKRIERRVAPWNVR